MRYFPESRIALAVQTNRDFLVDPEAVLMDAAKTITRRLRASE
jgi:hypothetical protein